MNALVSELKAVQAPGVDAERRRDNLVTVAAFVGALLYATLRYNVFKGVAWADWPSYIVNKSLGLGALLLLAAAVHSMTRGRTTRRLLGWAGAAVLGHVALSFTILNPAYLPKFFENSKLTFVAGLSLAIGTAAVVGMEVGARKSAGLSWNGRKRALATIAAASGLHAGMVGMSNWWTPADWPGAMPPITLLSLLLGIIALVLSRRDQ